ncbi:hypothetical protein [Paenibacillus ferrarius]|uniref:hypothetical protein n=1 Tax=Paenibacillus ferrarius TaxID=1469647 RepID=UPI003D2765C7
MKAWIVMVLAAALAASGCSKKGEELAASPTPGVSAQPSTGASASPGATPSASPGATGGGGGTSAAPTATAGTNAGTPTAKPSPLTKEQVDKIAMTATYDDVVKQTGAKGTLVKDENGKKTYEYVITNQPGYYAEIVYFSDGKISEKRVYQK